MTNRRFIEISPRGFANETFVRWGTLQQVAEAHQIINDDVNAWATVRPASHPVVRAAKREELRFGRDAAIQQITDADLRRHRPEVR